MQRKDQIMTDNEAYIVLMLTLDIDKEVVMHLL